MHIHCLNCRQPIEVVTDRSDSELTCPSCGTRVQWPAETVLPSSGRHLEFPAETTTFEPSEPRRLGHFELLDRVGVGHFGEVWKARDQRLDRTVAIKLPRTKGVDPRQVELFLREARSAAQLRHHNIVPVHEVGHEDDTVYIVSDFIRGIALSDDLLVHPRTPEAAARLCATVAMALEHAHQAGVIHRDLKPANILIDEAGQPHLTDFGLAKRDTGEMTIAVDGKILGTPAYMSPEQARGEASQANCRSDVYSLGVILYELLTGRRPFRGDTTLLLHQVINDEPKQPHKLAPHIPRDLETICLKAMSKAPSQRYPTARAMADDLERFLRREPIQARRISHAERIYRWGKRNPTKASATVAAACMAFVAIAAVADSIITRAKNAPLVRTVSLDTDPPNATVVFFPLDDYDGHPNVEAAGKPAKTPVKLKLAPGEYLVVADLPGHGFHEVYRRVPHPEEDPSPGPYKHSSWEIAADGVIALKPIKIIASMKAPEMSRFEAIDNFLIGAVDIQVAVPHHRRVPAFYLDVTEVTVSEFKRVMRGSPTRWFGTYGELPPFSDDDPVGHVSYDEAVAYAESVGKRLMDEAEYEVAATNEGKTKYPWGDDLAPMTEWTFGPAGEPAFDRLDRSPPVFGLYSNVAEWTSSREPMYPRAGGARLPKSKIPGQIRAVRGGPLSIFTGQPNPNEVAIGPRNRIMAPIHETWPRVGFRCARSAKPRFTADDFIQVITAAVHESKGP